MGCDSKSMTTGNARVFIQWGQSPTTPLLYAGVDDNDITIKGLEWARHGKTKKIWGADPYRRGAFVQRGTLAEPPDDGKLKLTFRQSCGGIPKLLAGVDCKINIYILFSCCGPLGDHLTSWENGYVMAVKGVDIGTISPGDIDPADDKQLEVEADATYDELFVIGSVKFGGNTTLPRKTTGVAYACNVSCGDCTPKDDGTKRIYWAMAGGGGERPAIVWTNDGGQTMQPILFINGSAANEVTGDIAVIGNRLVVLIDQVGKYYFADLDPITGAPGLFTAVTLGFETDAWPTDIVTNGNGSRIYFTGALNGTVYVSEDVATGVKAVTKGLVPHPLRRVASCRQAHIAVGDDRSVLRTTNDWQTTEVATFTLPATSAPMDENTSFVGIYMVSEFEFYVTTDAGREFYTLDGGVSWSEIKFNGSGTGFIGDALMVDELVRWFGHNGDTSARLFSSWTWDASRTNLAPRIAQFPAISRIERLAAPTCADPSKRVNQLAVAGMAADGTHGVAIIGAPNVV